MRRFYGEHRLSIKKILITPREIVKLETHRDMTRGYGRTLFCAGRIFGKMTSENRGEAAGQKKSVTTIFVKR